MIEEVPDECAVTAADGHRLAEHYEALRREAVDAGEYHASVRGLALLMRRGVAAIGDHQKGLNTWGPESRLFQIMPSVFALRVNNILFLNASWEFMCSRECGYLFRGGSLLLANTPTCSQ